jgi:hypothetical protein
MNQTTPRACVVVPIYRTALGVNERLSLTQCVRILGRHPLVLLKPESLDAAALLAEFPGLRAEALPDANFASIRGYNRMMLSPALYERFCAYDYVLIHQLDTFVFRDELLDWCARGYDYVGAPWIKPRALESRVTGLRLRAKQWLFEKLERRDPRTGQVHPVRLLLRVGNGGLSLRRVAAFIEVLQRLPDAAAAAAAAEPLVQEDVFYSLLAHRRPPLLRTPDFRTAARFAIETSPRYTVEALNAGALPFGCHAWDKYETAYWRAQFERSGYPRGSALNP